MQQTQFDELAGTLQGAVDNINASRTLRDRIQGRLYSLSSNYYGSKGNHIGEVRLSYNSRKMRRDNLGSTSLTGVRVEVKLSREDGNPHIETYIQRLDGGIGHWKPSMRALSPVKQALHVFSEKHNVPIVRDIDSDLNWRNHQGRTRFR